MWHPCLPAPRSWAGGAQVPHPCRQQWAAPVPGVWGPCLCPLPSTRLPVLLLVNGRPLWGAPTSWEPGRIHAARSPPRLFVAASLPLTTPVTLSPGPSLLSLPSPTSELASGPLNCTDLGGWPSLHSSPPSHRQRGPRVQLWASPHSTFHGSPLPELGREGLQFTPKVFANSPSPAGPQASVYPPPKTATLLPVLLTCHWGLPGLFGGIPFLFLPRS